MNSKPHRALLVKILNEAHVAQDIFVEGFGGIINNITANNYLTFANEEIPVEGRGHNRALHVSVECLDHIMAKVLIEKNKYYLEEPHSHRHTDNAGEGLGLEHVAARGPRDFILTKCTFIHHCAVVVQQGRGSRRTILPP